MRLTLRARLTLVYGGLFLVGGILLLVLTHSLIRDSLPDEAEANSTFTGTMSGEEIPTPEPG